MAHLLGDIARCLGDFGLELLNATWWPDRPAEVPEVALHLARHGRNREAEEVTVPRGVEPLHGLDEPEVRDLHEVFVSDAPAAVATRDGLRDAHVQDDHFVLQPLALHLVGGLGDLQQQPRRRVAPFTFGRARPRHAIALRVLLFKIR
jgi:hypothetical protein